MSARTGYWGRLLSNENTFLCQTSHSNFLSVSVFTLSAPFHITKTSHHPCSHVFLTRSKKSASSSTQPLNRGFQQPYDFPVLGAFSSFVSDILLRFSFSRTPYNHPSSPVGLERNRKGNIDSVSLWQLFINGVISILWVVSLRLYGGPQ